MKSKNRNKLYIKFRKRQSTEFQFHMHDFVDDCIKAGICPKRDLFPSYKFHVRSLFKRIAILLYRIQKKIGLLPKKKSKLLITATGGTIDENVFPYLWGYDIVPILWDCWPGSYQKLLQSIDLFDIKTVFVTSSKVADKINSNTKVKAYWLYEGIRQSKYCKGEILKNRPFDIIELGRRNLSYHTHLESLVKHGVRLTSSSVRADGRLNENNLLYNSEKEMAENISLHKIMVCFPQSVTNPKCVGDIETLTQRYWEAMLSRCLILGHAPNELISVMGYNPCIEVDSLCPEEQVMNILNNIDSFQQLVDENYRTSIKLSSWESRINKIKQVLI